MLGATGQMTGALWNISEIKWNVVFMGEEGVWFFSSPPEPSSLFRELVGRQPARRIKWATLARADGINNTGASVRSRGNRSHRGDGFPGVLSAPRSRDSVKMKY